MNSRFGIILKYLMIWAAVLLIFANGRGLAWTPPIVKLKTEHESTHDYYKIRNKNSGKILDVTFRSTLDGIYIVQFGDNWGANQLWEFIDAGSGYYKIKNKNSGKLLDVEDGSVNCGAQIVQWADNGSNSQLWQKIDAGSGFYKLQNKKSGQILDIRDASKDDGGILIQFIDLGGANQLWEFVK